VVRDYKNLADQIRHRAMPGDWIVVENTWYATPIHYYLRPSEYHLIPSREIPVTPPDRVWIIGFGRDDSITSFLSGIASSRLPGRVELARLHAFRIEAALYGK